MSGMTLAILLGALATFALRVGPILFLAELRLPTLVRDWLGFIPTAVLSALIAVEVLVHPQVSTSGTNLSLFAMLAAAVAGLITRSLFLTVGIGVGAYFALSLMIG